MATALKASMSLEPILSPVEREDSWDKGQYCQKMRSGACVELLVHDETSWTDTVPIDA